MTSISNPYRFVAEATTRAGVPLGALALTLDWEPAAHWAYFEAMRQGRVPPLMRFPPAWVAPFWHEELGQPYVDGVRLCFRAGPADQAQSIGFAVPNSYFQKAAEHATAGLVADGKMAVGETFTFRVCAYPDQDPHTVRGAVEASPDFRLEEIAQPLPLQSRDLQATLSQASCRRADSVSRHPDMPLLVRQSVLDEAAELTRRAGHDETGGFLIGRLCRDAKTPEIFAELTAQIPAQHSVADRTSLKFTPETWSAAKAAIALRGRDEMMLGWWHSHPHFCANCPAERRSRCALSTPFFSDQDRALHRAAFPRAFDVALLMSNLGDDELSSDVFGWRQGMVVARAYHVSHQADRPAASRRGKHLSTPIAQPGSGEFPAQSR